MSLEVTVVQDERHGVVMRLAGRLDTTNAQTMDQHVDDALAMLGDEGVLIFDMATLDYISSAGLRSIFRARKLAGSAGSQALLVNLQPQIRKVFDIVKAVPLSEVFASEQELEHYLDTMQRRVLDGSHDDDSG
ncbi:MAG: STAS domain-containing protein [Pseudoxanthomonas suwonensis]|nr:STAS domain-containing protein [Pseudoxanthomonas suwonensis]